MSQHSSLFRNNSFGFFNPTRRTTNHFHTVPQPHLATAQDHKILINIEKRKKLLKQQVEFLPRGIDFVNLLIHFINLCVIGYC